MTTIPRVDRRTLRYEVSAKVGDRVVDLTSLRFAVFPVGTRPDRSTEWSTVQIVDGVAEVPVAGPEAPADTDALFFLEVGDYLVWYQLVNGDDTITDDVERISVS